MDVIGLGALVAHIQDADAGEARAVAAYQGRFDLAALENQMAAENKQREVNAIQAQFAEFKNTVTLLSDENLLLKNKIAALEEQKALSDRLHAQELEKTKQVHAQYAGRLEDSIRKYQENEIVYEELYAKATIMIEYKHYKYKDYTMDKSFHRINEIVQQNVQKIAEYNAIHDRLQ